MIERKLKRKGQKGFTLIELGVAMAIMAVLVAFLLPGFLKQRDDAKVSTALGQLQKDFPGAISRQVARTNTCSTTTITAAKLQDRGVPALTVWNTAWTVDSVTANAVTISYTLASSDNNTAADMVTALNASNNINSATATGNTKVTVTYPCN
ncbi:TPA: type II secretion system protein [Pseudomonas aeruginosa]